MDQADSVLVPTPDSVIVPKEQVEVKEKPMIPELLTVLRKANANGEIGYAYGDKNEDLPLVQECVRRGLISYVADVSPGVDSPWCGQKRDLYRLTSKGRLALVGDDPSTPAPGTAER